MICGIYKIQNILDNKIYIGSSVNIQNRKYKHFWLLSKNKHDNKHLQNSFNKNSKEVFEFTIIELCDYKSLVERENYYINYFKSNDSNYGYNLATVNEFRRNTYNEEVKIRLSSYNLLKNGNFNKFSVKNIETNEEFIFESLVSAANYLIENGYAKGKATNVRIKISEVLRGVKVNNGNKNGSIRKTCYKHICKIIN